MDNKRDIGTQVLIDNGWNDLKIKQLKRKREELKIYQYLHKDAGTHYKKLHQFLFLPQTTIMTIATGTLFISLSDKIGNNGRYWINIFVSFLTLIGSILSVWVKFFNANQQSYDHLDASKNYSIIIDDIEEQLSLENNERTFFIDYLNKIKKLINEQKKQSLDIDKQFWDKYFKSASKGDLIMLNNTFLDQQINKELNIDINNTNSFNNNPNNPNNNLNDNLNDINNINNIINNINNINNNNNNNSPIRKFSDESNELIIDFNTDPQKQQSRSNINQNFNQNLDIDMNDLKKKLMYELQRNI